MVATHIYFTPNVCPYCRGSDQHRRDCRVPEWNPRLSWFEQLVLDWQKQPLALEEAVLIRESWEE